MRSILDRERARADRSGDPVSVVTFTPADPHNGQETLTSLARLLPGRMRCTDEVGWLTSREICVVMPNTGVEGARKVIEEICQSLPTDLPSPVFTLYVYPQEEVEQDDSAGQPPSGEQQPIATAPALEGQPIGNEALALETLLVKPMPLTKRVIDVLGALVGLLILAPLFLLIAVAIKLSSRGPVFFKQRRSGRGGKPFSMYKFRTMVVDAEARKADLLALNEQDGPAFKMKKDPRVTRVGRFLRQTSLDELPQLWNVLTGDMSLVGPRPLPCSETESCAGWQRRRLEVTPGITCFWQVRGRSSVSFADWVRMDVQYIRSQSLPQDLKLLFLTVPAVLLRRGAH
jgi:lipopolysaccharide/colanic/teichoic acid biosynthesis glycosyltransferase